MHTFLDAVLCRYLLLVMVDVSHGNVEKYQRIMNLRGLSR